MKRPTLGRYNLSNCIMMSVVSAQRDGIHVADNKKTKTRNKRKPPEIILRGGKPSAVILDISDYKEMLERLEDIEDLKMLEKMRKKPQSFKPLADFLAENNPNL